LIGTVEGVETRPRLQNQSAHWFSALPASWHVTQLKHALSANEGGVWGEDSDGDEGTIVLRSTDVALDGKWDVRSPANRRLSPAERSAALLRLGDLLVTKSSGSELHLGKTALVTKEITDLGACFSNFMQRLRPAAGYDAGFMCWFLNSRVGREQFNYFGTTTTGLANLSGSLISSLRYPVPPLPEQRAIADYLDRETARIDALLRGKQELLALLGERRQAEVSRSVTRGLRSNAATPALEAAQGQVPSGWRVQRLKHVVEATIDTEHKTAPFYPDGEYLVVRTSNVRNGILVFDDAKYTDRAGYLEWTNRGRPRPGDILFTREAPAGEACLAPDDVPLCLGQRMVLIRPDSRVIHSPYLLWALYGGRANEFIRLLSQGSTVAHFNMSDIANIPLAIPPIAEQREIARHLDRFTGVVDRIRRSEQAAIASLEERRQALITAAVTGQLDVARVPA
jgi:type I restriction enzyme, S subunit